MVSSLKKQILPLVLNGLDNKAQRRTRFKDVFFHDLFDDGGLPRVV